MNDKIHTKQDQIISKLKSLLEIKYIYESRTEKEGFFQTYINCDSERKLFFLNQRIISYGCKNISRRNGVSI